VVHLVLVPHTLSKGSDMLLEQGDELRLSDQASRRFDLVLEEDVANAVHVERPGIKVPLDVAGHGACRHCE